MSIHLPPNYKELSDDVLLDLKVRIERDLDRCKAQIDTAKAGSLSGTYADPGWWARVNTAKRSMGRYSQMIQTEMHERKNRKKAENIAISQNGKANFERAFMKVAKRRLTGEVYQTILDEAQEENDSQNQKKGDHNGNP